MVHDRINKVIYIAISERSNLNRCKLHAEMIGYKIVCFKTESSNKKPFYHTNVVMSVGETFAVVNVEGIVKEDREKVLKSLKNNGKEIIEVNAEQAEKFYCANILQVRNMKNKLFIIISR